MPTVTLDKNTASAYLCHVSPAGQACDGEATAFRAVPTAQVYAEGPVIIAFYFSFGFYLLPTVIFILVYYYQLF